MGKFLFKGMAGRFASIVERSGGSVDTRTAGTGTIYVTVDGWYKVRFADHGECYCSEHLSVDPDGCSLEQAVRAVGRECELDVTRSLASFKAAATRKARISKELERKFAPIREKAKRREDARLSFQAIWLSENCPDYEARSNKSRKRARHKANAAFEAQYVS